MNSNQFSTQWNSVQGQAKSKWGKLTDEDIRAIAGDRDQLIDKVQQRYGFAKAEAEHQVTDWITKLGEGSGKQGGMSAKQGDMPAKPGGAQARQSDPQAKYGDTPAKPGTAPRS